MCVEDRKDGGRSSSSQGRHGKKGVTVKPEVDGGRWVQ